MVRINVPSRVIICLDSAFRETLTSSNLLCLYPEQNIIALRDNVSKSVLVQDSLKDDTHLQASANIMLQLVNDNPDFSFWVLGYSQVNH